MVLASVSRPLGVLALAVASSGCAHGNDDLGSGGSDATSSTTGGAGATGGESAAGAGTSSGGAPSNGGAGGAGGASPTTTTTGGAEPGPGAVFFSEYVEGTGNNKALEIVNTTASSFNLAGCVVDRYQNGATSPAAPAITLDATSLGAGQTYVLCNTNFAQTSLCDQLNANVSHTGNDAVVLVCDGNTLDAFGQVGVDMVWGTAPVTSQDATLRRKCSVDQGDTNPNNAFNVAAEWDGFAIDTFSDLGAYNCP